MVFTKLSSWQWVLYQSVQGLLKSVVLGRLVKLAYGAESSGEPARSGLFGVRQVGVHTVLKVLKETNLKKMRQSSSEFRKFAAT